MAQGIDLKAKGVYTHPNPLGSVPAGALLIGDNIVIDREDTIETRRGLKKYGSAFSGAINKFFEFNNRLLVHYTNKIAYDSNGSGTWVDYSGTYAAPTGANRIRGVLANKNFYFTTSAGIYKIDSLTGTPKASGAPKGLDGYGSTSGASGWFANNTAVAYRVLFGYTDANSNKVIGAPSARFLVLNTAGATRTVDINFTLPTGLSTSYFYQIYRSGQSPDLATEPTDELQLIVEKQLTGTDITNGYATYTDETPDNLRGATLYTSPSQQGIALQNEPPPLAQDITLYKNNLLYANTISRHRLNLTIISIGGTSGLVNDDTIVIAGTTYTGKATETIASGYFQVFTGGTPAENIDNTARSLVKVINRYSTNTLVYAYYVTGYNDLPGQILVEERGIGGSQFVAISSRGSAFSPNLPSSGTSYASNNDVEPNAVMISKLQQPEAVPVGYKVYAGAAQKKILRIIALRDSAFVLKEDGVFRITGETAADITVTLFDSTTKLKAEESAVSFGNSIHCMSDQGEAYISDSGVNIISRAIEFDLISKTSSQYTNFESATFGISYESDRKYIMGTVTETSDTYATQLWVYNSVTRTYTRWPWPAKCGLVLESNDKLYLGNASNNYVYVERKNFNETDYAEEELAATITGHSGLTVNVSSTTGYAAGDTLAQFSGIVAVRKSVIVSVDNSTDLTVTDTISWVNGSAIVFKPIEVNVSWSPIHGGNPGIVKQFRDIVMFFRTANFNQLEVEFTSNQSSYPETFDVVPSIDGLWGFFPWGGLPWGQTTAPLQAIRTLIPAEKTRCHWYNFAVYHSQALSNFSMVGITTWFDEISEVVK
jgi:hypothetical protein